MKTADDMPTGLTMELHPLVRRVLAPNPSPFTFTGTQTYLVGRGDVAVIDPGPSDARHINAILAATKGETIRDITCTHTHRDHSPGAAPLKEATGAQIVGCAYLALEDAGPRADAAFDSSYAPDRVLEDGELLTGEGWTLETVATPGHTSNHLCYALHEAEAMFTGDHIMGWSTTVIAPPDGDMKSYMESLAKLIDREETLYYPAHGEPIEKARRFTRGLMGHRKQREGQILRAIDEGLTAIPDMVQKMYKGIDPRLHGAAGRSVLAHLIDLRDRGLVEESEESWSTTAA
ncbi:MBL fold metallo-hydrolase [Parasphingopyxis lamellibrachiae]|nr:MBL fold metallo-hydrolase [Parasphingopyxis lamellibrachiae]